MRPPLAPDWRELSLGRSNVCVPQRSQLFNRASKNRSVSGKPCFRDHLSLTTIRKKFFPCTVGWSLKTGFTVINKLINKSFLGFWQPWTKRYLITSQTTSNALAGDTTGPSSRSAASVRICRFWTKAALTVVFTLLWMVHWFIQILLNYSLSLPPFCNTKATVAFNNVLSHQPFFIQK